MKLSQMPTAQLAQLLCDLTPPLCRIAADPAVSQALSDFAEGAEEHQPLLITLGRMAETLLPALMQSHAEDAAAVLALLTGKDAQTVRAQPWLVTLRDMKDCWDGELRDFFASAGITAAKRSSL